MCVVLYWAIYLENGKYNNTVLKLLKLNKMCSNKCICIRKECFVQCVPISLFAIAMKIYLMKKPYIFDEECLCQDLSHIKFKFKNAFLYLTEIAIKI